MTKSDQNTAKLAKFLEYVLARRPDEFGLIPDAQGFVRIKTLLQALHEDPEYRHVRQGQLNAIVLLEQPAPIEIQDTLVRARIRDQLPVITSPDAFPKLLYTAVRQRAYPVVHEKGIRPGGLPYIMLSPDEHTAKRLGKRVDNHPVLLTIQVAAAQAQGACFQQYGERLYLADFISPGTFSGPPLPKEKVVAAEPKAPALHKAPGSFFPDITTDKHGNAPHQRAKRNEIDWKKDRRRARKEKARRGYS